MPANMLLLETAIIGVPSFFLSLQPNKERVQGKFIAHVMSGAVSGALLMIICVMAMYLTAEISPQTFDDKHRMAMCMLALTFSGFVMVFRLCKPFNVYRTVLCASVLAICVVALYVTTLPVAILQDMLFDGWSELTWDYGQILTIVVIIEAAFPLSSWLIKIMHVIMPTGKKVKNK